MLRLGCHRGLCAASSTKPAINVSASELLSDTELQSLLRSQNKSASEKVSDDQSLRLALLARFSARTGRPVASDMLGRLETAEDMATWFSKTLRHSGARPHARGMIRAAIGGGDLEGIDSRIDTEREKVQEEFLKTLPGNLELDARTFRKPDERKFRKRARPIGHIVRKVREVREGR